MTRRVVSRARELWARLFGFREGSFRGRRGVNLSDESFFHGLSPGVPELNDARRCFEGGDTERGRRLALEHFRGRVSPRFHFDGDELPDLLEVFRAKHVEEAARLRQWARRVSGESFPIYGAEVPGLSAGFRWDRIPPGPQGDDLYPLRAHRFGFAPKLALAARLGEPCLPVLENAIGEWKLYLASGGQERAFASNLVAVYRVLATHWTLSLLRFGDFEDTSALAFELLKILHCDAGFLAESHGDSTPNNHLLADGFGLWYVSTQFPEFRLTADRRERAERLWLAELRRQYYDDGTSFEHSMHYHELGCEMAVIYLSLSQRNGLEVARWVRERTARMLDFQRCVAGVHGASPMLGDGTEDSFVPLAADDGTDPASIAALHLALGGGGAPAACERRHGGSRAFWMLGGRSSMGVGAVHLDSSSCFLDGGYFVFPDNQGDSRLLFRTGPAPEREVFAGHMHADPLTVYLDVGSSPIFVEAGTYTYATRVDGSEPDWRAHFLGRESHNGLILAGKDPYGEVTGSFRPREMAARVSSAMAGAEDALLWAEGEVLGRTAYAGCKRGVVHVCGEYWLIYDIAPPAAASSDVTVQFQLPPGARVQLESPQTLSILVDGEAVRLHSSLANAPALVQGEANPPRGWVSRAYGEIEPAPALRFPLRRDEMRAAFVVSPERNGAPPPSPLHLTTVDQWLALRLGTECDFDCFFVSRAHPRERNLHLWGVDFTGRLLWLRVRDSKLEAARWIEGSHLVAGGWVMRSVSGPEPVLAVEARSSRMNLRRGRPDNLRLEASRP